MQSNLRDSGVIRTIAAFFCIMIVSSFVYPFVSSSHAQSDAIPVTVSSDFLQAAAPTRLRIPAVGIDALIESKGLTADQAMAVPAGPIDVAWYDLGIVPGQAGSAVIAGHYGWIGNVPAAFDRLSDVKAGDWIYADNRQGMTVVFVVDKVATYAENEDASVVFHSSDGISRLNLITCEGVWDPVSQSYSNRLVVFAHKQ